MVQVPSPEDVEQSGVLPLEVFVALLRSWRNHWAEVERIARDFPEDVKKQTLLRPRDPAEALEETRAQFAVLFHPEAIEAFTSYLSAALRTVEALVEGEESPAPQRNGREGDRIALSHSLARLEEHLQTLDVRLTQMLESRLDGE